jgi:hypothetical protein
LTEPLSRMGSEIVVVSQGERRRQTLSFPPGPASSATRVTALLTAWRDGNRLALDELVPLVDAELRRIARGYLRRERLDTFFRPLRSSTRRSFAS